MGGKGGIIADLFERIAGIEIEYLFVDCDEN